MNMKSDKKKKIKIVLSTVLAVLCLLLIVGGVWLGIGISREKRYEKQISLGDKYLEELDYENARIAFENAIEISEKKAVGYVKLAVLYIKTGDYESALETVEKGREKSGMDNRFEKIQDTISQKDPSLLREDKGETENQDEEGIDWEQAFSATLLGQLPMLGTDALNYKVSDGDHIHPQEGIISAQQIKLEDKLYLACIYLKSGESAEGVRENQLHFALYEGADDFSLLGESQLKMTTAFSGSYIRSQNLGVYYRENDGKAQWIFVMDTVFWESKVQAASILSFDRNKLSEEWNSLVYGVGGNQSHVLLNEEELIYHSGTEDTGNTPEDVQETFRSKLETEELSEGIFQGEAGENLETICWLENQTENLQFNGEAAYKGTLKDYTQIGERIPETEEYTIPQEQWNILSDVTGIMLWYLEQHELLSEEKTFTVDELSNNDVGYMMLLYLDSWDEKQKDVFPALRTENTETVYSRETAENFARSLTGKEPEGILTGIYEIQGEEINYLSYENGEYRIPMADGAPMYRTRYLQGSCRENQVVVVAELIQQANVGTTSEGIYEIVYEIDEASAFGYHFVSVKKVPQVNGAFTRVEASSELQEAGQDHSAAMLRDENLSTAWSEGVSGTGVGESITLYADGSQKVHGVRIAPGFYRDQDLFEKNGRPTRFRFTFSNGTELEGDLTDSLLAYEQYGDVGQYKGAMGFRNEEGIYWGDDWDDHKDWLDFISFGQEIETEWIKITIVSAEAGSKYEDTCITELVVY